MKEKEWQGYKWAEMVAKQEKNPTMDKNCVSQFVRLEVLLPEGKIPISLILRKKLPHLLKHGRSWEYIKFSFTRLYISSGLIE